MAMSFSRPDPASPAQVADASFSTGRRGFDQNEVRDFLRMVSAELGRLRERETFLERELVEAQNNPDLDSARLDDEALTRLLGEETARVLNAARESAHEIREKAEQSAARMLLEASDEATRMREEAEIESSRRRSDAAADAEAELSMAKQQGREMVTEARAYRERVLSELARRRELAREQIEQLIHGRDRLMQAFERARLVAVDVVSEMQPLGEPDEYVNLQASTGPVPVMVARQDVSADDAVGVEGEVGEDHIDGEAADPSDSVIPEHEPTDDDLHVIDDATDTDTDDAIDTDASGGADGDDAEQTFETAADDESDGSAEETSDTTDAETSVDEAEESPVDDTVGDDPEVDDEAVDGDVVVDLFARLRADSTDDEHDDIEHDDTELHEIEHGDIQHGDIQHGDIQHSDAQTDAATDADAESGVSVEDSDTQTPEATQTPGAAGGETADEVELTVFDRRDADLTPLIVASARKLKRVLADEQNEVLDALRRSDPVRNLDALLPWPADHTERYASAMSDDLLAAAQAGAALADPETPRKLRKAAGRQAVAGASEMLGQWLVQPLRDRLERCVSEGDGDNAAITKKVRAVYRECKTRHIDEQLDDVVRVAHGRGLLGALAPDTPVEWTPDPSHEVCADCDDNRLAGVVASGQEFPTGQVSTPAHPGCRCMLVPVAR